MATRRATLGDAEAIAPLLGELGYPCSAEDVSRRLTAMASAGGTAVLVATDQARITGVATVHEFAAVLHNDEKYAQLTLLVVASGARRRGVGRQLVFAVEDWARQLGCSRMLVATGEQREDAHAFYSRLGYAHTARRYAKLLSPTPDQSGSV